MRIRFSSLTVLAVVVATLIAAPVLSVFSNVLAGDTGATWSHLADTVLGEFVFNTVVLCIGVGLGVSSIGVTSAWLTTMLDFPGRRFLEWALVLPLAMPAYVMAYVYTDFLQFVGPVQGWLRETFGWGRGDYWFPDVRTVGGAVAMFMFVLYPYVYMIARTAFLERAGGMLEAGRTLGLGPWGSFFRVSLPLARPALAALTILTLVAAWNQYIWPSIVMASPDKFPLSVGVLYLSGAFSFKIRVVAAGAVLTVLPILIVFLFTQRYFLRGFDGAVK